MITQTGTESELIYRQQAIDALGERPHLWIGCDYELGCVNQYDLDKLAIETVPSAQPKKGKWNFIGDNMFECSMCGVSYTTEQLNSLRNYNTDPYLPWFCPHCGSDMRGEKDG